MARALAFKGAFREAIEQGRKSVTIRLGDRRRDFGKDQQVRLLLESNDSEPHVIGDAIIESVEVQRLGELRHEDIEREGLDLKSREQLLELLSSIYARPLNMDTEVTLVRFRVVRSP